MFINSAAFDILCGIGLALGLVVPVITAVAMMVGSILEAHGHIEFNQNVWDSVMDYGVYYPVIAGWTLVLIVAAIATF